MRSSTQAENLILSLTQAVQGLTKSLEKTKGDVQELKAQLSSPAKCIQWFVSLFFTITWHVRQLSNSEQSTTDAFADTPPRKRKQPARQEINQPGMTNFHICLFRSITQEKFELQGLHARFMSNQQATKLWAVRSAVAPATKCLSRLFWNIFEPTKICRSTWTISTRNLFHRQVMPASGVLQFMATLTASVQHQPMVK